MELEKSLDPNLWHACAGSMVQIPPINSKVYYFPQGHAEHSLNSVDFPFSRQIPPLVLCRVDSVKFMADVETDEVYAKIMLTPLQNNKPDVGDDDGVSNGGCNNIEKKAASFAKTLTQSDANNGGGFSVPRYCAETIFPALDYSADPPVQTVVAVDVHGQLWKFRHIYRGTPRRHLLTTGWSAFVNRKKLVAGDSVVFLRAENGGIRVGIRRAKLGIGDGDCYGSLGFYGDSKRNGKVKPEEVLEAAKAASGGRKSFEVVYYPRTSRPEFCVRASAVNTAMKVPWCCGMRFKMAFETEDSSRISWFVGTISSVQVADPVRWPDSPWRLLEVTWDEPDLLQNVNRVNPWSVELASNVPAIHLSPFLRPVKKLRLPQHLDGLLVQSFPSKPLSPSNPFYRLSDNAPVGIQGARQVQFGLPLSDLHLKNNLNSGLCLSGFQRFDLHDRIPDTFTNSCNNLSCNKSKIPKKCRFLLFGQPILTEQQLSQSSSSEAVSEVVSGNSCKTKDSSNGSGSVIGNQFSPEKSSTARFLWDWDNRAIEPCMDTGHCKVFMESEDVGRTLDLSVLDSYEDLYRRLANMFGIERSKMSGHVLYRDATGDVKRTGDEPFSAFMKIAKRLTIRMDSSNNTIERSRLTGTRAAENGFHGSNKTGPLSIFA
ncbi:Auxin response factor 18 [Gossypium arboreum]|uniref:Auxin response factor n=1 Tax=Gossypium arboreum TaxID=29729 RepID=A0A0B0NCW8_GOSAR|nr:auxin response factor 10-like [Gossypium arboreum]KHG09659.1 Auxin response factor 18 [Gossypium arboreum]